MSFELKPHQLSNSQKLIAALSKYGAALDASDTGSGKTATALAVCKKVGAQPAIVTPKAVISGWEEACEMVGVKPLFITSYEAARFPSFPFAEASKTVRKYERDGAERTQTIKNFKWRQDLGRVVFIFDEVQRCKNRGTYFGKMLSGAADRYKTLMLSATPFTTPLEAETIGAAIKLFPKNYHYRWALQHGCKQGYFGGLEFIGDKPDGKLKPPGTNAALGMAFMKRIHEDIFPERGCRTRREEIPDFPETVYEPICVECEPESEMTHIYRKYIAEAREMDMQRIADQLPPELREIASPLPITQDLRNRQESELMKCPTFVEMAKDAIEKGESVIIVANFDHTLECLAKHLGADLLVRGEKSHREPGHIDRKQAIKMFQANQRDVILVNACAGGAGLSLHDYVSQKPRRVIISPPWSALMLKQVFGRAHRLGGGYSRQQLVFAKGTVEERVMNRVKNRLANLDYLVDGDLTLDLSVTK